MAYTQQSFTVNVNVRGFGVSGGSSGNAGTDDPTNEDAKLTDEAKSVAKAAKDKAKAAKLGQHNINQMALGTLRQVLFAGLNYTVSGIGMNTGDQFLQAKAQRVVADAEMAFSALSGAKSGAISGAAAGAMFGGIGALAGAAIGAILGAAPAVISRGQEYVTGQRNYNYQVWKEQSNINYARARANAEISTGRRER